MRARARVWAFASRGPPRGAVFPQRKAPPESVGLVLVSHSSKSSKRTANNSRQTHTHDRTCNADIVHTLSSQHRHHREARAISTHGPLSADPWGYTSRSIDDRAADLTRTHIHRRRTGKTTDSRAGPRQPSRLQTLDTTRKHRTRAPPHAYTPSYPGQARALTRPHMHITTSKRMSTGGPLRRPHSQTALGIRNTHPTTRRLANGGRRAAAAHSLRVQRARAAWHHRYSSPVRGSGLRPPPAVAPAPMDSGGRRANAGHPLAPRRLDDPPHALLRALLHLVAAALGSASRAATWSPRESAASAPPR